MCSKLFMLRENQLHRTSGLHRRKRTAQQRDGHCLLVSVGTADIERLDAQIGMRNPRSVEELADKRRLRRSPDRIIIAAFPADDDTRSFRCIRSTHLVEFHKRFSDILAFLEPFFHISASHMPPRSFRLEVRNTRVNFICSALELAWEQNRSIRFQCFHRIIDRWKNLIFHFDLVQCFPCKIHGICCNNGNRISIEVDFLCHQILVRRPSERPPLRQILVSQNCMNTRHLFCLGDIDAENLCMCIRRTQHLRINHSRNREVIQEDCSSGNDITCICTHPVFTDMTIRLGLAFDDRRIPVEFTSAYFCHASSSASFTTSY